MRVRKKRPGISAEPFSSEEKLQGAVHTNGRAGGFVFDLQLFAPYRAADLFHILNRALADVDFLAHKSFGGRRSILLSERNAVFAG